MSTIQEYYKKECVPQLMEEFGYKNVMQVPKLEKIVLNMGLGEGVQNPKSVDLAAQELTQIAEFIAGLGTETPWHVSAFHPDYRMTNLPRTSVAALRRARQIGFDAGLEFVYSGNVPGDDGESTYCPGCKTRLIHRVGFRVLGDHLKGGKCPECGRKLWKIVKEEDEE